jgi:hypothetical protein
VRHKRRSGLGVILLLLLSALILGGTWFYTTWRSSEAVLPATLTINGLSMAGMTRDQALAAIEQAYTIPVTVTYAGEVIAPLLPETIELRVDLEATAQNLDEALAGGSGGLAFSRYVLDLLRNREPQLAEVPAVVLYSRERVDAFLERAAQKYDHPPLGPVALPDLGTFRPAMEGTSLNSDASLPLLIEAILAPNPTERQVDLIVETEAAPEATLDILEQALDASLAGFGGVAGIYAKDLVTGNELCLNCESAYTGMTTAKIGVALEIYRTRDIPLDAETVASVNEVLSADDGGAMEAILAGLGAGDVVSGAMQVTDVLWNLGLRDSYIAGLVDETTTAATPQIATQANTRADVTTQPDPGIQSTPTDAGLLFEGLYQCARGGGVLRVLYPRAITPIECEDLLARMQERADRAQLVDGLPGATRAAYVRSVDGDTYSEIALVSGPRVPFVLAVFLYQPDWMEPQESLAVFSEIGVLTYRFFNGEPEAPPSGNAP